MQLLWALALPIMSNEVEADPGSQPLPIIDGMEAEPCAWPNVARLQDGDGVLQCSATLIHPLVVVTVGHCLFGEWRAVRERWGRRLRLPIGRTATVLAPARPPAGSVSPLTPAGCVLISVRTASTFSLNALDQIADPNAYPSADLGEPLPGLFTGDLPLQTRLSPSLALSRPRTSSASSLARRDAEGVARATSTAENVGTAARVINVWMLC
jgi:hypothetical protein